MQRAPSCWSHGFNYANKQPRRPTAGVEQGQGPGLVEPRRIARTRLTTRRFGKIRALATRRFGDSAIRRFLGIRGLLSDRTGTGRAQRRRCAATFLPCCKAGAPRQERVCPADGTGRRSGTVGRARPALWLEMIRIKIDYRAERPDGTGRAAVGKPSQARAVKAQPPGWQGAPSGRPIARLAP